MLSLLIKTRISAMTSQMFRNSKRRASRGIGFKILMGILVVYVIVCLFGLFSALFVALCQPLCAAKLGWLYFAIAGILTFALSFIGSVFMAQSQLYDANDNELLLSMPIKPAYILFSRLIAVFVINCAYGLFVFIPACIVFFIFNGFSLLSLLFYIIGYIFISIMAMTLSCIIGWVIALISSKMRNKNIVTMIFSLLFLAAYFYIYSKAQTYIQSIISNSAEIARAIRGSLFPVYHMGKAMADTDPVSLLIFILCAAVPALIVYLILSKSFIKIASAKKSAAKKEYRAKALKVSGASAALTKKELRHFFSNPMYMLNAALGCVLMVILPILFIIKPSAVNELLASSPELINFKGAIIAFSVGAMAAFCFISAPSVSLEGKSIWIAQSLPVPPGTILVAKAKAHIVVCLPPALFAVVVFGAVLKPAFISVLAALIFSVSVIIFTGFMGVAVNLRFPRLDWINETMVVKQGASSCISLFVNMGILALLIILFVIFNRFINPDILLIVYSIILIAVSFLLYTYLKRGGAKRFMAL